MRGARGNRKRENQTAGRKTSLISARSAEKGGEIHKKRDKGKDKKPHRDLTKKRDGEGQGQATRGPTFR